MKTIIRFDFGNVSVAPDKGFYKIERLFKSPSYMWMTELRNRWTSEDEHSPYKDYVTRQKGEFRIACPAGKYLFTLHFYDKSYVHPSFIVRVCKVSEKTPLYGGEVYSETKISVPVGEKYTVDIPVEHVDGDIALDFAGYDDGEFFINGLDLLAENDIKFNKLFASAPDCILPEVGDVEKCYVSYGKSLRDACEWLMLHRTQDGFIGDYEMNKRLWYTSSYPLRTLLAGYDLLGDKRYYETAKVLFDRFVSEQLPGGGFTQSYRGVKTADLTEEEMEKVKNENWMNLADIGSMVAALCVMIKYTEGSDKIKYTDTVYNYLKNWAMPYRQSDGGFANGWTFKPDNKVYSVSTASTALSMLLFYRATGNDEFVPIAENAVSLLCENWRESGEMRNYIFNGTFPGHDNYQSVLEFGDGFYTLEALSAALAISENKALRKKILVCIDKYIYGSNGIARYLTALSWWPLQNNWNNSKSCAVPMILADFAEFGAEIDTEPRKTSECVTLADRCMKFLCTAEFAKQLGVMTDDPPEYVPFSKHGIQSWTGCSVAATGFAGITYAEFLQRGSIFLNKRT